MEEYCKQLRETVFFLKPILSSSDEVRKPNDGIWFGLQTQSQNAPAESETQSATATDEDVQPPPKKRRIAEFSCTSKGIQLWRVVARRYSTGIKQHGNNRSRHHQQGAVNAPRWTPRTAKWRSGCVCGGIQCQQISNTGKGCTDVPCTSSHQPSVPSERLFMWLGTSLANIVHASTQTMLKNWFSWSTMLPSLDLHMWHVIWVD